MKTILFVLMFFKFMMKFLMFRFVRKIHQVFRSIIIFNAIDMVNAFRRFEESTKFLFHNKARTRNIIIFTLKRMITFDNIDISLRSFRLTFPTWMVNSNTFTHPKFTQMSLCFLRMMFAIKSMIFTSLIFRHPKTITFFRTKLLSLFFLPLKKIKQFFTLFVSNIFSSFFTHIILQKLRASFSVAYKKQLSFFTLTKSPILAIKKLSLVSIIIIAFLFTFVNNSFAKIYVCLSKTTGEPRGTVDINEKYVADWAKNFILVEAGEEYRGKNSFEIKYEQGKLRKATQAEIDNYLAAQEDQYQQAIEATEKAKMLKLLDDNDIKTKIKDINKP